MSNFSDIGQTIIVDASRDPETGVTFSIGCLVSDSSQYKAMRASMESGGFTGSDVEYLVIDNTGPQQTSAYLGLNAMLASARGRYTILCHQDVRLLEDDRNVLEMRLDELNCRHPGWALAGNAGGVAPGRLAMRISDPHGANQRVGELPARVTTLDENFIVIRRLARIGFSRDLSGFHFYGADACLAADVMGYSAYVIDFHLAHLSAGKKGTTFEDSERAFRSKWSRALRPRWLQTTCSLIRVTGDVVGQMAARVAARPYAGICRRLPGAQGWTGSRAASKQ